MSRKSRKLALPWLLGLCAAAFSLVAANKLMRAEDASPGSGAKPPAAAAAPASVSGMTVLGTVDAPIGIARVDAPSLPALSGVMVSKVHVKDGDQVKVDDVLIDFDSSLFVEKIKQAEAELAAAKIDLSLAETQIREHDRMVKLKELAVDKVVLEHKYAATGHKKIHDMQERQFLNNNPFTALPYTEEEKERIRGDNLELLKADLQVKELAIAVEAEKQQLELLKIKPLAADKERAEAKVKRIESNKREAEAAVRAFQVKARVAGTVEQVAAVPSMTFGPTTRTPALYIVPAGKRIVRAEVEAEFAHRIADRVGTKVVVYDSPRLDRSYEGTVVRVATGFLYRRGSADTLSVNSNRILECEIEIADPPAGKPPLLIGLPVRVVFPQ